MIRSRITTALLILEIVVSCVLLVGTLSKAVGLSDFGISRPRSLDVEFISENQGINGDEYQRCTTDIFTLFKGNLDGQIKQWAQDAANTIYNTIKNQVTSSVMCGITNALNHYLGIGTPCTNVPVSDTAAELKTQLKNRLKQNFLVSCTSTVTSHLVEKTVTDMIQTQGPCGGAAYAEDWVYTQSTRPAVVAQRRFWTQLVNTNICPQFKQQVLNYFEVPQSYRDNPPTINTLGFTVNEEAPFDLRGQCTLPKNFSTASNSVNTFQQNGGWEQLQYLLEPQNTLEGFIGMAQSEYALQKEAMLKAADSQLMAGGGFLPVYGDKNTSSQLDPDGNCIDDGRIKQPPGATRDIQNNDLASLWAQAMEVPSGEQGALEDFGARLRVRMLDLANKPLDLKFELGPEQNPQNFTPVPTATLAPGETATNDAACTGGNPNCTCVKDNSTARSLASGVIGPAVSAVIASNPTYFENGTSKIAAGIDFRLVLQAICNRINPAVCQPHPAQDDEIMFLDTGFSTTFDVITGDGYIRTDGGSPVAMCSQ